MSIYVAHHLIPSEQKLDDQEFLNVEIWELKDLITMIYRGELTDSKTVCGLLAYALQKKSV